MMRSRWTVAVTSGITTRAPFGALTKDPMARSISVAFSTRVARPVKLQVLRNVAFHHLALAPSNRCHIDGDGTSNRAIAPTVTRQVRDFPARNLILAWHTGDVRTRAANPTSFHDGCPSSRLRHMPSDKLAPTPAAEDENFQPL